MGILAANLKHFYQRRVLWLIYVFLPLPAVWVFGPSLPRDGGANSRAAALFLVAVLGVVLGSCQREIASRPFAFLLPRHSRVVPRQALFPGVVFGALVGCCWLTVPHATPLQHLVLLFTASLLGTACYMGGTVLAFKLPYVSPIVGFLPALVLLLTATAIPRLVDLAVTEAPLLAAAAGVSGIAWAWIVLSRRELSRRWCENRSISIFDEFNFRKAGEYHMRRRAKKAGHNPEPGSPTLARVCLAGISKHRPDSLRRYWYAVGYEWFGHMSGGSPFAMVAVVAVLAAFLGYVAGGESSVMVFAMPAVMVISMHPAHTTTFVPVGRSQRRDLAMAGMLTITVLQTAVALLMVVFSHQIAPVMPPLSVRGVNVVFRPFPYLYALIPLALAPSAFALVLWLKRRSALLPVVVAPLLLVGTLVLQDLGLLTPLVWSTLPFLSLAISFLAIRHHCLRRDIV